MKEITLEEAEKLALKTDYACFANEEENEINTADAGAFFLEGYNYAIERKKVTLTRFTKWFCKKHGFVSLIRISQIIKDVHTYVDYVEK